MDTTHLHPFLDALHRRDASGLVEHMSDAVELRGPILPDPVRGKAAAGGLFKALLTVLDRFEVTGMVTGDDRAAVFVTMGAGEVSVDGVDDIHLDASGLIGAMTILWRPLPAIVVLQQRLAPLIGAPVLTLARA